MSEAVKDTSRWLSGDPALSDYVPAAGADTSKLAGMGGVYNTVNLHLYHYSGNNPVKYTDPDGKVLKIAGNTDYQNQVMGVLKKLDPNVSINRRTGVVTTTSTDNSAGAQLIRSLQTNKNTVTIRENKYISTEPKSREKAETLGVGTDSTIFFSTDATFTNEYFVKDKDGNLSETNITPPEIALGHELIHGLHYAEGSGDNTGRSYSYGVDGILDGKYVSDTVTLSPWRGDAYPREEARTIGVGEYKNDPITENALRRQLKYAERLQH